MTSILGSLQDFADEIKNDYNIDTTFNVKITIVETIELIKSSNKQMS